MEHRFKPGDLAFFQLEAGFALIKVLAIDEINNRTIWHVLAYSELFPDVESIENAVERSDSFAISISHVALTNRAFESTQVAAIGNVPLSENENVMVEEWRSDPNNEVSDLSIRLLTGLR